MPSKPKGKKLHSSTKVQCQKPHSRRKYLRLRNLLQIQDKTQDHSHQKARIKRGQTESIRAPQEKRLKMHPLTTADIPDIVLAVVKAMPQSAKVRTTHAPWKSFSCHNQKNTANQPS